MPKFEIIDDKSLYKQQQKKNFTTKEEMIEAQMIKLKQFEFFKAINKSNIRRIGHKKSLPQKGACYNLRKQDIQNNHISVFRNAEDERWLNQ